MAVFPPGRTLIVPHSQLWSRGAAVSVSGGTLPRYPAANATDGRSGKAVRTGYGTAQFTVTLGGAQTPNIFGVISHNIDYDLVCGFKNSAGLDRGAAARPPNFWLDLRGFPTNAASWTLAVNSSTRPLSIGEIVIGTGFEFNGTLRQLPDEDIAYWQERALLEYGKVAISASGAHSRRLVLDLVMSAAEAANLEQIADEAAGSPYPVVVVPNTLRNEIYYVHWPETFELQYPRSAVAEITASLQLDEEGAGVV